MSSKLSEIESRTASARQLETVIGAMRGIAAAREREAQARLAGIRSVAATVGEAIGMVLAAASSPAQAAQDAPPESAARILIVLCTEQGFVGGFNEHLLARVERLKADEPGEIFIVGTRGMMLAQERALHYGWSVGMATHAEDVMRVAGQIADAVFARFRDHASSQVWLVHATPGPGLDERIVTRRLVPFDFTRFRVASRGQPPLLNLPLDGLLRGLTERYVYLELCEGLMQSFAAESAARVATMLAASRHVKDRLQELTRDYRIVRQDEITAEIAELAATGACAPIAGQGRGQS
ncbi:F0F1 ATP synthase subunit gamma [Paraburkholderia sp. UYCP14C]|uniref:F0F1 ATP synthase subunit gamma n=1 Tax=Paraburkholderia sp. UYCP14C TaxID=2511130 RepID=UPI00101FAD4B|nr:FoF1 ATP synthase subunit gamma [Paraburkholderia sp. UYCP14C]RZF25685.1 F0F1 ATP synthase subunit gamma [Paraburkholderia sp. UYCP14C]